MLCQSLKKKHGYSVPSLKHTQIPCTVTGTHTVHGHWNTHSTWSLEHTQRMVTRTHTAHCHWNTHNAWSLEHTVHGLKNTHSIRSVKHTYILGIVSCLTRSADIYHKIYIPKKN